MTGMFPVRLATATALFFGAAPVLLGQKASPFPGTRPLTWGGDLASELVAAADAFLIGEIERSRGGREVFWNRDSATPEAYADSVEPNRQRFRRMVGAVEERRSGAGPWHRRLLSANDDCSVYALSWPAFGDVRGEGLLIEPREAPVTGNVVVIPDADQTPEAMMGWGQEDHGVEAWGKRAAERACRVVIPTLIDRGVTHRNLSDREFLYRSAFELGRHLIGYEILKIQAVLDWFEEPERRAPYVSMAGWGEGGLLALYTAALDRRVDRTLVGGYFGPRESVWEEPAYRNLFGLLGEFGDAEIASLVAPRRLVIDPVPGPEIVVPPGTGGKPGRLTSFPVDDVAAERDRAVGLIGLEGAETQVILGDAEDWLPPAPNKAVGVSVPAQLTPVDVVARQNRQFRELDRHNQQLLAESPYTRAAFMDNLKTESLEAYEASVEAYREHFAEEVMGRFDRELRAPHPRSRVFLETETVTVYEVVLDVFDGLFLYGLLCWPKDLEGDERRPVVVCQHGLEGRPQMVIGEEGHRYYKAFAMTLAERGFITFAPQHLYIFEDRFRILQFKANALKKTLFSLMVPQHEQLTRWLGQLDHADPDRIAFYGLSYGGKSAMRIPPLVSSYCLSICSADFNDWVWKNASSRSPYSYVWTGEYEIFEFDLGSTFNYAEMAALIAPRPFMVERGHFDGVAPDERVALEFAKVRHLYAARLKLPDRVAIEWFDGPHTINGRGTYDFLHRHLNWPQR